MIAVPAVTRVARVARVIGTALVARMPGMSDVCGVTLVNFFSVWVHTHRTYTPYGYCAQRYS